jgi:hypothetical protein
MADSDSGGAGVQPQASEHAATPASRTPSAIDPVAINPIQAIYRSARTCGDCGDSDLSYRVRLPCARCSDPKIPVLRAAEPDLLQSCTRLVASALAGPVRAADGIDHPVLAGNGGHSPAFGFKAGGGPPIRRELPGIALAALTTLSLGAVLGPEAPLIAIGGGLGHSP